MTVSDGANAPQTAAFATMSDVVLSIASELSLAAVLTKLVHAARDLAGARYAALGVPDPDGTGFAQFLHVGMSDELVAQLGPLPRTHGLLGAMLAETASYRTDDITQDPRFSWWPAAHPRMRSFLGVPILSKGDVVGAFYLTDKRGAQRFDATDQEIIELLAAHAAIAIENAQLYERSRELSIVEERNRLARELHDAMTQNLFSLSLTARAARTAVHDDPDAAAGELARIEELVRQTLAELRTLIFDLRPPELTQDGLVPTLRRHANVLARVHGIPVEVTVSGERRLDAPIEHEVLRVAQEALGNAVRHGRPGSVRVAVAFSDSELLLEVADDGVGFEPQARSIAARRLGLTSMRERARALGGTLRVDSRPSAGTRIMMEVPIG